MVKRLTRRNILHTVLVSIWVLFSENTATAKSAPKQRIPQKKKPIPRNTKTLPASKPQPTLSPQKATSINESKSPPAANPDFSQNVNSIEEVTYVPTVTDLPQRAIPVLARNSQLTISDIQIGSSVMANYALPQRLLTTLITRLDRQKFVAFKNICPHQGGQVELNVDNFKCSRHGLTFNLLDGHALNETQVKLAPENLIIFRESFYYLPPP